MDSNARTENRAIIFSKVFGIHINNLKQKIISKVNCCCFSEDLW